MEAIPLADATDELDQLNEEVADATAEDLIAWAVSRFGDELVASTSFGAHSAVLLHMLSRVAPKMPVIFIDTGYLFPETYRFAEDLTRQLGLRVEVFSPQMTAARQEALYGQLWEQGEEGVQKYLQINKVEPMQRALDTLGARAWIAGLRREQTEHRASLRRIDHQDGRYKLHPILEWTLQDMHEYLEHHELPYHPLYFQGYRSIGDWHSTLPTTEDMDPREGRILGQKRECGIHLTSAQNASYRSSGL